MSRYWLLDGVRGIAAIAIMARHMELFGLVPLPQSYLGVDLFFMLSGAVIAGAYESKLLAGMSLGEFMGRRLIRLYPMILLGTFLGLVNALYGAPDPSVVGHVWPAALLAVVVMPDNPFLSLGALNRPAWSLSFELLANAAYAKWIRWLSGPVIVTICTASAAVLVIAAFYKGNLDTGFTLKAVPFGAARVGFSFFLGVALYRAHARGLLRVPAALRRASGVALVLALVVGALAAWPSAAWRPAVALGTVFVMLPAVVVLGLENDTPGRLRTACSTLGEVSYPLYLIHFPLSFLIAGQLLVHHQERWLRPAAVGFALFMPALAWLADRGIDRPARQALTAAFGAGHGSLARLRSNAPPAP